MGAVAIYNGFGKYETNEKGQKGITLTYGGIKFWLPYKRVAYIPDYTFREVDHQASSADIGEESVLTYRTFRVTGERIAEELLETQIPVPNKEKGILLLDKKTPKNGLFVNAYAGITEEGVEMTTEVPEVEVTEHDVARAERLAREYKERIIQEYFQSKSERMAGGHGRLTPAGLTKTFMEELGVKDIDTLPTQSNGEDAIEKLARILGGNSPAPVPNKQAAAAVEDLV